jgi:kynureninase
LSTNLHLLMVSFYRPTNTRFKIIMEEQAFPSDQYAVESQVKFHGFDPEDAIIEVKARPGEDYIRTEDIEETIKAHSDSVALVFFSGVNYYTGQFFEMERITACAHDAGAIAGFDLAHAAGNVVMNLHDWNVDFAAWCSYKYLNSGPGGPSGVFVHEKHGQDKTLPRFAGWWGHDEKSRFKMEKGFIPMEGAQGWQLSNAQVLSFAALKSSIEIFEEAGIEALRAKSLQLTSYMESLINGIEGGDLFKIITPSIAEQRGAQLSMLTQDGIGKELFDFLSANGVICDWREPNVIRLAAVPMYNSFEDVWNFVDLVKRWIKRNH